MTSWSLNIPADTWHSLAVEFHEGYIRVLYKSDNSTTWTVVGTRTWTYDLPWSRDQVGRGALYVQNVTPNTVCYGFNSDVDVVAVAGNYGFSAPETVIVDDEQMTVTGVSSKCLRPDKRKPSIEGNTFSGRSPRQPLHRAV